jgi:hypothetical protein
MNSPPWNSHMEFLLASRRPPPQMKKQQLAALCAVRCALSVRLAACSAQRPQLGR